MTATLTANAREAGSELTATRWVAVVSGLLGFVLSVLTPLLPVVQTTATLNWPQGGQLSNVTAPLISLTPVSVTATVPCEVLRSMPPQGGLVLGLAPQKGKDATLNSLFVTVGAQRVDITDRNVVIASVPRAQVNSTVCQRIEISSTEAGTFATFVGLPPAGTVDQNEDSAQAGSQYLRSGFKDPNLRPAVVGVFVVIVSGLMVSRGSLLVGRKTRIPASRALALLRHEVGTHVLTYHNGRAQPFRQLYSGLAGYEALQEGLAVLAEYLAGGMSSPRLRLLAARVIAVHALTERATFVDTFRLLVRYGFEQRIAFLTTLRVFRGGGLTKDGSYLSGLLAVLEYVRKDGDLEPLLVGKIAARHIPLVRELQWRKVVVPPLIHPRYLSSSKSVARLEAVRRGLEVHDLVERKAR